MINGIDRGTNIEQSGTEAERVALDIAKVKQGTEFYETDTTARYKFMSGAWVLVTASGGAAPGYGGGGGGGGGAVTIANGADNTQGARADAPAAWYNTTASLMSKIGLMIAAMVDAGTHAYTYDATFTNKIATDTWTLFGVPRVRTFTYNADGMPQTISDWV